MSTKDSLVREHGDENLLTYIYDRNRVFKTFKGTQCAYVQWKMGGTYTDASRLQQQQEAVAEAVRIYTERWGRVEWWTAQFLISHTTASISVEMRVEPS